MIQPRVCETLAMATKTGRAVALLVLLSAACSPGAVVLDPEDGGSGESSSSTGIDTGTDTLASADTGTDTSTESETAEPEPEPCGCVMLDEICGADSDQAMFECELPSPCGTVSGDAVAAECVLQLLVDQEPARFRYNIESQDQSESWRGWFYILGPGEGIDNECHFDGWDFCIDRIPSAAHFELENPAYFADCLGKSASVMTGCIFNGLSKGPAVAECPG